MAVAAPMSAGRTEFCTARIRTGITMPMPTPRTAVQMPNCIRGVSVSMPDSSHTPRAVRAVPRTGYVR